MTQTCEFHSDIQKKRNSLKEIWWHDVSSCSSLASSNDTVPKMYGTDVVPNSGLVLWPHVLTERQCSLCKFNSLYLHRLGQWANTVQWDLPQHESTNIIKLPHLLLGFSGIKVPGWFSIPGIVKWTSKHPGAYLFHGDHKPHVSVSVHLRGMGTMEKLLVSKHGRNSLNSNKSTCIATSVDLPYQKNYQFTRSEIEVIWTPPSKLTLIPNSLINCKRSKAALHDYF